MREHSTLLTFLGLLLAMSAAYAADIGVAPSRLSLSLGPGQSVTEVLTLYWTGAHPIRVGIQKADWTLTTNGNMEVVPPGGTAYSATSWITVGSSGATIAADGNRQVRVSVRVPRAKGLAGTYRTVLLFRGPATAAAGAGARLTTRQQLGVVMYVTVTGTETRGSELADMYIDRHGLHVLVDNTGNSLMRVSGSVEFRDESGKTIASVPVSGQPVLRGSEREFDVGIPAELKPGYYVALALLKDSRGGLLSGQLPIQVH